MRNNDRYIHGGIYTIKLIRSTHPSLLLLGCLDDEESRALCFMPPEKFSHSKSGMFYSHTALRVLWSSKVSSRTYGEMKHSNQILIPILNEYEGDFGHGLYVIPLN